MPAIPPRLQARFEGSLEKRSIPNNLHGALNNGSGTTWIFGENMIFQA